MRQKKESPKIQLWEKTEITTVDVAKDLLQKEKVWLKIKAVCTALSLLFTLLFVIPEETVDAMCENPVINFITEGILFIALIAVFVCAFKMIIKLFYYAITKCAWFGYLVIPYAGFDVLGGLFGAAAGLVISICVLFMVPVVVCAISLVQTYMNYKDAKAYLEYETAASSVQGQ